MSDLLKRFRSVGENVRIAPDVFIAHPEDMDVGSNVTFERGVHIPASLRECRIGDHVTFSAYTIVTGTGRLLIDDHVGFYVNTCIELGREGDDGVLKVGHHSHFAPGCLLYGNGGLDIGPYCNIAAHTVFATPGHDHRHPETPMALLPDRLGPIRLVRDVWIGANATVTMNTTIAEGCVIGANAVVTRDTEPYGIYAGVPARRIAKRR